MGKPAGKYRVSGRRPPREFVSPAMFIAGLLLLLVLSAACGDSTPDGLVVGVGTPVETAEAGHVGEGQTVSYSTTPPTSGAHWPAWAGCGIYDTELPDERIVHNMEHGQVIISHNLSGEDVNSLLQIVGEMSEFNRWGVLRRYSKIDEGAVGMTAWGVMDVFQGVDRERINNFYDAYRANQLSEETRRLGRGIPC